MEPLTIKPNNNHHKTSSDFCFKDKLKKNISPSAELFKPNSISIKINKISNSKEDTVFTMNQKVANGRSFDKKMQEKKGALKIYIKDKKENEKEKDNNKVNEKKIDIIKKEKKPKNNNFRISNKPPKNSTQEIPKEKIDIKQKKEESKEKDNAKGLEKEIPKNSDSADKINKKKNSMHNSDENLQKEEKLDDDNNINNEVNSFDSDFNNV